MIALILIITKSEFSLYPGDSSGTFRMMAIYASQKKFMFNRSSLYSSSESDLYFLLRAVKYARFLVSDGKLSNAK